MKHRNLHHGVGDEPLDERLRIGRKAQQICTSLQQRFAETVDDSEPMPANELKPDLPVNDDYLAYLESVDVRN